MTEPFEFKNPLDGAPRPLDDGSGKNPFADEQQTAAETDNDNVYATTSGHRPPDEKPEYVTTMTHRGPLLLGLAVGSFVTCIAAGIFAFWDGVLVVVLFAGGALAVALAVKTSLDLRAMRAGAMHADGRRATFAAWVLSLITIGLSVLAAVWHLQPLLGT